METQQNEFHFSIDSGEDGSEFQVRLPAPLYLEGEWCVAIRQGLIPATWYNITLENNSFSYWQRYNDSTKDPVHTSITPGYYSTIDKILTAIYDKLNPHTRLNFVFVHDEFSNKVVIKIANGAAIRFSPLLGQALGFHAEAILSDELNKATYPAVLDPISNIFVYSSMVQQSNLADSLANIVDVVSIKRETNTRTIYFERSPLRFHKVLTNSLHIIQVSLRDISGQPIKFNGGRSFLSLVLRRIG